MVSPSPYLKNKLRNTKQLLKSGKGHLLFEYSKNYPHEFLDMNRYNNLIINKPWKEHKQRYSFMNGYVNNFDNVERLIVSTNSDKILILCVDFNDRPSTIPISTIYNRFFGSVGQTFKNYYLENSYGQYIPDGLIYGWYRLPNTYQYYIGGDNGTGYYPTNSQKMVEDALNVVENDISINLNMVDVDSDNIIDRLIIVHAGGEAAWGGDPNEIWAHAWEIAPKMIKGKMFSNYATTSEYMNIPTDTQRSGIDIHEYGHLLGLPDLYDYSGNSEGVGMWSSMGSGSWANNGITPVHFDAWSKKHLGWMTPSVNMSGQLTLRNSENYPDAVQYNSLTDIKEYFILENRQKILYDTYLPGSGILIWHVNENMSENSNENCYLVGLVQADSRKDLENNINRGDTGDAYPGSTNNRTFGKFSQPPSLLCNGSILDIDINQISDSSASMAIRSSFVCPEVALSFMMV